MSPRPFVCANWKMNLTELWARALLDELLPLVYEELHRLAAHHNAAELAPQGGVEPVRADQHVVEHDVSVVLTGHCGPKAFKVLQSAGIKIMTGAGGTVTDAIAQFNNGELEISAEADVEGHWV